MDNIGELMGSMEIWIWTVLLWIAVSVHRIADSITKSPTDKDEA